MQAEVRTPSKSGLHGSVDVSTFDVSAMADQPQVERVAAGRRGLADVTTVTLAPPFVAGKRT